MTVILGSLIVILGEMNDYLVELTDIQLAMTDMLVTEMTDHMGQRDVISLAITLHLIMQVAAAVVPEITARLVTALQCIRPLAVLTNDTHLTINNMNILKKPRDKHVNMIVILEKGTENAKGNASISVNANVNLNGKFLATENVNESENENTNGTMNAEKIAILIATEIAIASQNHLELARPLRLFY